MSQGSVSGHAWTWRAILAKESPGAIRPCLQFQIDIGVGHLITWGTVADNEEGGILVGQIEEMMTVAGRPIHVPGPTVSRPASVTSTNSPSIT